MKRYFLASNLKGFRSSSLRVLFVELLSDGRSVNVRTADLLDSGTPLTLDLSQLEEMGEGELPSSRCPVCGDSPEWCPESR